MTEAVKERKLPFLIIVLIILFLPFLGKGGLLAAAILAAALVGSPLFVLIGIGTLGSLFLWSHFRDISQYTIDNEAHEQEGNRRPMIERDAFDHCPRSLEHPTPLECER